MTDEKQIAALRSDLALALDRARIAETQVALLQEQIKEMQAAPELSQHSRWFGYRTASTHGSFDMLEVWRIDGSKPRGAKEWTYTLHFRDRTLPLLMDAGTFAEFEKAFTGYLKRT